MDWRDEGVVLGARPHGETSVILDLLTREHGRWAGVVHGGVSRRMRPVLQPGNQVSAAWRARLEGHLGSFSVELSRGRTGLVMADPLRLAALTATCALAGWALPEREAVAGFSARTEALCDAIAGGEGWLRDYPSWEAALLEMAGYGMDLSACAGGGDGPLAYVSPRSGRAVSEGAARGWEAKLLPLPAVMTGGAATLEDVRAALRLTGFFLRERMAPALGRPVPPARDRLEAALARA